MEAIPVFVRGNINVSDLLTKRVIGNTWHQLQPQLSGEAAVEFFARIIISFDATANGTFNGSRFNGQFNGITNGSKFHGKLNGTVPDIPHPLNLEIKEDLTPP